MMIADEFDAGGDLITERELLASTSSVALRAKSGEREAKSSACEAKHTKPKIKKRSRKPLSRPRGRHAVARSDTSDEADADAGEDPFAAGGYRFRDLQAAGIVSNRTDLNRKQRLHGFPRPIKTGERSAWFPKAEVHAWLKMRAALRIKEPET